MSSKYIVQHDDGTFTRTQEGEEYLAKVVTNTEANVYSFYDTLDSAVVAAALARLRRFGGGMRELLLKEFAEEQGEKAALLRRVLTQFGDGSVAQLGYVPVVVENASNLLTKQLEWGRLAAYLEQSTRYIYYDEKLHGEYRYFTPGHLPAHTTREYRQAMDAIFDSYCEVVQGVASWLQAHDPTPEPARDVAWRMALRDKARETARGLLPVATTTTVGIVGSAQAIDNLILHLLTQDLVEAQDTGRRILEEVRKQHAIFFERTDVPDRGRAVVEYQRHIRAQMKQSAQKLTTASSSHIPWGARLLDCTPKDELELLAHTLYSYTTLSFDELRAQIATWSVEEQVATLKLYMGERAHRRQKPGRALEVAHYTFEVHSDYGTFRDLQRHRMVDALESQPLTPYLGYEVPQLIRQAGLEKTYRHTYELSTKLYELLQANGFEEEAQYATLLGHGLRWKVTMNARAAFHFVELQSQSAAHSSYSRIVKALHEEIAKVHPRVAAAMIFANHEKDTAAAKGT